MTARKPPDSQPAKAEDLRRKAEECMHVKKAEGMADADVHALLHELQVHQIELEMQNEELLRAQTAEKEASNRYQELFDFAPVGYFLLDEQGRILEINLAGAALISLPRSAALNQRFEQFVAAQYQAEFAEFCRRVLASDVNLTCEIELLCKERRVYALLEGIATPGRDGRRLFRVTATDITERKRTEEEKAKLESQLQQAQKMESVGRLAGGVAHDFNNMLGVVLGHVDLALEQVDPNLALYTDLMEIRKATQRSTDLTRQLLAFARKQTIMPRIVDLNVTVAGMLNMMKRLLGEDIEISWRPAPDLWPVSVDESQIDQIMANLCVNSRDAIPGVGKMTIETKNITLDENFCSYHLGFMPGEYVQLSVSDNGCGMDKEAQSHLFEPFFTTKGVGQGTGLGLSTVYGAIKQNNGFIEVHSEPDSGTTFRIYLPRHIGKDEQMSQKGQAEPVTPGKETILLVEDEPAILKLATRVLEMQGYHVMAANTPGEIIRMATAHSGEIHLLITDVVMPEMNGRDLARQLLSIYPRLKQLFMSGYTADIIAHNGVLDEGVSFIQKPFSPKDLAAKIRSILDNK